MKLKRLTLIGAGTYLFWKLSSKVFIPDDVPMSFEQRCEKYGLKSEKYYVTTEDDYILQIYRVMAENISNPTTKIPVFLQHGFQDSCMGMISNREKSPAVYLAKAGYDVWVGNSRGTKFSRAHKTLDPHHHGKYWDFTFLEMGLYDTKACIELVNKVTGHQKIVYIGISQGATQMIYALTQNQEWLKQHLSGFIALWPVVRPGDDVNESIKKATKSNFLGQIMDSLGVVEVTPNKPFVNMFYIAALKMIPGYFEKYLMLKSEAKPELNDLESFQRFWYHYRGGTSYKCLKYWGQIYSKQRFQHFDYGESENTQRYGSENPPVIDISNIAGIPIALMVGKHDILYPIADSRWIRDQIFDKNYLNNLDWQEDTLKENSKLNLYKEYEYGHLTFILGKDTKYLDDVQEFIRLCNKE